MDLTDDDVSRWLIKLQEFQEPIDADFQRNVFAPADEKKGRREHSINAALAQGDDFTAVLRLQVEVEQRVRDRMRMKLAFPERLGKSVRLELRQTVAIAAALDAIPQEYVKLINALGEIRNHFAHDPGFAVRPGDIRRLKETAQASGLDDTDGRLIRPSTRPWTCRRRAVTCV
ncbi:MAG TPA: hypothetical protein VFE16_08850 [Candidatus Cybelea sp.]|nr:hypothetical protein [Candidatus Cybelea sp.]